MRQIPIALKDHLSLSATTTTLLLRIAPVTPGFPVYGVTELDRDVVYDDGAGELTYHAPIGMVSPTLIAAADLSVDQPTAEHLLPEYDIPELSEAGIRAGAYDFAEFDLYLVNYRDLSQGHVHLKRGTIGKVSIRSDGLSFVNELRDLAAQLKQSICTKDSLTCRAIFGSQPIGSSTPGPQVNRDPCGFDATTLLVSSTVELVGVESTLTFKVPETLAVNELVPGIVTFTTGANAGRTEQVIANTADGWITLAVELPYPIAEDDEVEYRPDCSKIARDEEKGCKRWHAAQWVLNNRSEPDIPLGDEGAALTPGAGVGAGSGGATNQPFEAEA